MRRINYYITMMKAYMHKAFCEAVQYPMTFFLWFISAIGKEATGFIGIILIAKTLGGLGGWNLYEICVLFGMAMIPEAVGQVFFDSVWNIGSFVKKGEMDTFLIRPLSILFQLMCNRYFFPGIVMCISGVAIVVFGEIQLGMSFSIGKILFLLEFIIVGTILNSSVYLIFNCLNFWLIQGNEISNLVLTFRQFAKYPLTVFPAAVKICMTSIIPFGFVGYYPALYMIGKGNPMMPVILPVVAGAAAFIGIRMWCAGIRGYNSTGT